MRTMRAVLVPVLLFVLIAGGWTAFWHFSGTRAEELVDRAIAREAERGRVLACGERYRGGYPFRMEITCRNASIDMTRSGGVLASARVAELRVVAQVWSPGHVVAQADGPLILTFSGELPPVTVRWRLAQASAFLTLGGYDGLSVVVDEPTVDQGGAPILAATRWDFHTRPAQDDPLAADVATSLSAARFVSEGPGVAPTDAAFQGVARNIMRAANRPHANIRDWQQAGGVIDIQRFRVARGQTVGILSGRLGLTDDGKPNGEVTLALANVEAFLRDTGLGGRFGPIGAAAIVALGRQSDVEGRPGRTFQLRAQSGAIRLGPIGIPLPSLY